LSRSSRRVVLLALLFLTSAAFLSAQAPQRAGTVVRGAVPADGAAAQAAPGLVLQRAPADSAYIVLLEKLNDQLGWRWNPINVTVTLMAVVVAVLGLVFAGGTVVAGWLLFRQGREFREQSEQSIREHRAILGAIVESWRRETDAAFAAKMAEYDQSIVEQQAKLDHLTGASAEQRAQAERDLERLKRERDAASAGELEKIGGAGPAGPGHAGRRSQALSATPALGTPGIRLSSYAAPARRYCTSCGHELPVAEIAVATLEHSITGASEVVCTRCGARTLV
jgi:hypothetical protein